MEILLMVSKIKYFKKYSFESIFYIYLVFFGLKSIEYSRYLNEFILLINYFDNRKYLFRY